MGQWWDLCSLRFTPKAASVSPAREAPGALAWGWRALKVPMGHLVRWVGDVALGSAGDQSAIEFNRS